VNLIVLESRGIDVILGMDWLNKHKGLIDYVRKVVKLTIDNGEELAYVADSLVTSKRVANCTMLNQLDASPT
jgi:hypothetical protein